MPLYVSSVEWGEVEFTFHFPEVKGQDAVLQPRLYFL